MAREKILFDKTEVTLETVIGKKAQVIHLPYDRITSVTLEPCRVRRLFKTVDAERIVVRASGYAEPMVFRSDQEGSYFESYKEGFRTFCRQHHITFYDKTADNAAQSDGQ
ncbi:MAG: hypothetical protein ACOX7W_08470 [Christensenellales bacterium]|jgi:hypothetical protein